MTHKVYPSDFNNAALDDIKALLPPASKIGSPRTVDFREIFNAIFYLVDNGIKWRSTPHDFPPWPMVCTYFRRWTRNGLWAEINTILFAKIRLKSGRQTQSSLIIIDSQSVKMAQKEGLNRVLTATSESKVANAI